MKNILGRLLLVTAAILSCKANADTIIIDNTAASYVGTWASASSSTDKYGADYRYASSVASATTPSATATFQPTITTAGKYDVYIWYPQGANRPLNAPWTITYNGGTITYAVNQRVNGGSWQLLAGGLDFAAGTAGSVKVGNNTGATGSVVMADAVKFSSATVPVITSQPQSQSVLVGATVNLTVESTSTSGTTYQWTFQGNNISGATTSSLTLANIQPASAGVYNVILGNSSGTVTSDGAFVTVNYNVTMNTTLGGAVSPSSGWQQAGSAITLVATPSSGYTFANWSGDATGSANPMSMTVNRTLNITGNFTWSGGDIIVDNTSAGLSGSWIYGNASPDKYGADYYFVGTVAGSATASATYTPPIPVTGTYNIYVWYPEGSNRSGSAPWTVNYSGGTITTLVDQRSGGGQWRLIASSKLLAAGTSTQIILNNNTGESGTVVIADAVRIQAAFVAPTIVSQPVSQSSTVGNPLWLSVGATCPSPITYQWKKNGTAISGATSSSLYITSVQSSDAGSYQAVVTSVGGSVSSAAATVTVVNPSAVAAPSGLVNWWPADGSGVDLMGGVTATLSGAVYSSGKVSQAFSFDGNTASVSLGSTVGNFGTADFSVEFWLKTTSTRLQAVLGKRAVCNGTSGWDVRMLADGRLNFSLLQDTAGNNYNSINSVRSFNDGVWHHVVVTRQGATGKIFVDGSNEATGTTSGTTTVNNSAAFAIGTEACVGVDGTYRYTGSVDELGIYNRALTGAEIQGLFNGGTAAKTQSPVVIQQPTAITANQGANVAFTVAGGGSGPLSYQWRKDGANIAGATGSSLALNNVQPNNGGSYTVVIMNPYGQVIGGPGILTVNVPPTITQQPENVLANIGDPAIFFVYATGTQPLTYQWKRNGVNIAGATQSTYTFGSTQPSDSGTYMVTVANVAGSVNSANATLVVNTPPQVSATADAVIHLPAAAALNGTATDADNIPGNPLQYYWFPISAPGTFDDIFIDDYSAANTHVSFARPGDYVLGLDVSDSIGDAYTEVTIRVLPPLNCPLANGSFESGLSGWAGYMVWVSGATTGASDGSHYLGFSFSGLEDQSGSVSQSFCTTAGTHQLYFDLGGSSFDFDVCQAGVHVDIVSDSGAVLASQSFWHYYPDVAFRTESLDFTVPAGQTIATVTFTGLDDGATAAIPILDHVRLDEHRFSLKGDQYVSKDCGPQTVLAFATTAVAPPVSYTAVAATPSLFASGPSISPNGTLTFTPATGATGNSVVTVTLKDGNGVRLGSPLDFKITVNAPGTKNWELLTGIIWSDGIKSSAVIGDDGTIYFGARDKGLFALNPDGSVKWNFPSSGTYSFSRFSPAIGSDGTIYAGNSDGGLYAINPDGTQKWRTYISFEEGSPSIGADGTIYCGSMGTGLNAIRPSDGAVLWRYNANGQYIYSGPALAGNGNIYFGATDNRLHAIDHNGNFLWSFTTGSLVISSPAIGLDGSIYFGSMDGNAYCLNPDGTMKWSFVTGADVASVVIGNNGLVYFGSANGYLYAVNANTGAQVWAYNTLTSVNSSPALCSDGTIYVLAGGRLRNLNADGTLRWTFTGSTTGGSMTSPVIGPNGVVYYGSANGHFYAVQGAGSTANTPWPMFKHDLHNTGRVNLSLPVIVTQPASQTVSVGASAAFNVVATGSSLSYQWKKNGTVIAGQTQSTLTFSSVTVSDEGNYTVDVSNSAGTVPSATATLTVVPAPVVTIRPTANAAEPNVSGSFQVTRGGSTAIPLTVYYCVGGTATSAVDYQKLSGSVTIAAGQSSATISVLPIADNVVEGIETVVANLTAHPSYVIGTPDSATVDISDASSSSPELIVNGGFEDGLNNWASGFGAADLSTPDAPQGTHVALLPEFSLLNSAVVGQNIPVTPNHEYEVRFMSGKVGSDDTLSDVKLLVMSPDWVIRALDGDDELMGSIYASHEYFKSSSDYSQETFRFTAPSDPNITEVGIVFMSKYDVSSGIIDDPRIDSVSAYDVSASSTPCFLITTQPQSQQKTVGQAVTFTVSTSSGVTPAYQWKKNNVTIPGATSSSYQINNSQVANAGNYSVTVSQGDCTINSSVAALTICSPGGSCYAPPLITSHSCSQTACPGDTVNFAVSVTGTAPVSYQWRLNGAAIAGASGSTYSVTAAVSAFGSYDVVVANPYGTVTSDAMRLDIDGSCVIQITSQPQDQSVCPGESATFSVTATGPGVLSYQWKKDNADIPGATGTSYTITSVQSSDLGGYSVSVSAPGLASVTSRTAQLTFGSCSQIQIAVQPVSQQTCVGSSVTFCVVAYGPGALAYQWRKDSVDISGATDACFTIPSVQPSDVAAYSVAISGPGLPPVISQNALLTLGALTIVQQPESQVACLGGGVSLTVAASSTSVSYQWSKDGNDLASGTDSAYIIPNVTLADAGSYQVRVFNSCGTATSDIAVLGVKNCAYELIDVDFGDWLPASPKAGYAAKGLSWQDFWNMVGPDNASGEFQIPNALDVGQAPTGVTIKANSADGVGFRPAVRVGSTDAMFDTSRTSYNGDQIVVTVENLIAGVYDFYLYGHGVPDTDNTKFDLSVDNVALPQQETSHQPGWNTVDWKRGQQYVKFGRVTVSAGQTVTIKASAGHGTKPWLNGMQISLPSCDMPVINQQPASIGVCPDSSATFTVNADGNELTYQWSFNNSPIAGATDSTYTIPVPTSANEGSYKVVVNGCAGNVVSDAATLTLLPSCKNVLFYGPNSGGLAASTPGIKITVWDAAQWSAASTADFAAFDAIVFGDQQPCFGDRGIWQTAVDNRSVWSAAVNGNVIILGTDTDWHDKSTLVHQSVLFAADAPNKTGLYVALSCAMEGVSSPIPVELLGGIGRFTSIEADCANDAHKIANHPVLDSIDDAYLSGWSCSSHEGFHEWPSGFKPLAMVRDVPFDHETPGYPGLVYMLARGVTTYCPDLTGGSFDGSAFKFNVNGNAGETVDIFASEDTENWTQIGTITLATDTGVFTDTDAGNYQHRYYHGVRGGCCTEALGFIKVTVPGKGTADYGTAMVANQLNAPPNTLARLFPTVPEGTEINKWDPSTLSWVPATFLGGGWDTPNVTMSVGEGAYVRNPSTDPLVLTFIGRVLDGSLVNPIAVGRSVRSSMIPQAGLVDALGLSGFADNDAIEKWNSSTASYDTYTFSQGVWSPSTPSISVGESFFVDAAAAFNWTRTYSACCSYPIITHQPISQAVCVGQNATFTVQATGAAPLSYQWYLNDSPIEGATSSSYTVTGVNSDKVGVYTVTVSNPCGTIKSLGARLDLGLPVILEQPQSQTICAGLTATFTVRASAGVTYQWAKDGIDLANGTDSAYTINPVTADDAGSYTVTVFNACGSATSDPAVLTVDPCLNEAPHVDAGPDQVVAFTAPGTTIWLNGYAWDDGRPAGSTLTTTWTGPTGVTFGDINSQVTTATFTQPGVYTVTLTASDGALSASDEAVIYVTAPYQWIDVDFGPHVTASPKVGKAANGVANTDFWNMVGPDSGVTTVSIPCALGVDQIPTGVTITTGSSYNTGFDPAVTISSADAMFNSAFSAPEGDEIVVTLDNLAGGSYDFYLYGHGAQNSDNTTFELSVNGVVIDQKSTSAQAGWNTPTWQDGVQYVKFSGVPIYTSQQVTIKAIGTTSGKPWLNGMQIFHDYCDPAVITQDIADTTVCLGNSVTFNVAVTGTGLGYQWSFNGSAIPDATTSSYTVPAAALTDAGYYHVDISGLCGNASSAFAVLTVSTVPVITGQPLSVSTAIGSSAIFTVKAEPQPLTYQWAKDGVPIANATASTYIIPNVSQSDVGSYTVDVINSCGTTASSAALLSVHTGAVRPGFDTYTMPADPSDPDRGSGANGDDGSTSAISLGFSINYFCETYNSAFINMNGNLTFLRPLSQFTPVDLVNLGQPIMAPYWADVDTRSADSGKTTYGSGTVNGHPAFGVTWNHVGYASQHAEKHNRFQVVLISRPDLGAGQFDMEYNYDEVQWESADTSGGTEGLGGTSARVGFSDAALKAFELPGSAVNGAFLDTNPNTGLSSHSLNSAQPGRYLFSASTFACDTTCSAPTMTAPSFNSDGNFQFTIVGAPQSACALYTSTDAVTWTKLKMVPLSAGTFTFIDDTTGNYDHRYYKANQGLCCSEAVGFTKLIIPPATSGAYGSVLVADQFDSQPNTIDTLLPEMPEGTLFSKWNGTDWVKATFEQGQWDSPAMTLSPGEGALISNPSGNQLTIKFYGKLLDGHLVNAIPAGTWIRSSIVPQAGGVDELGLTGFGDYDVLSKWDPAAQAYDNYTFFQGAWTPTTPTIGIGESVSIISASAFNWVRDYSVCCNAPLIIGQPRDVTTCIEQPITITVHAIANESLTYQWQRNGNNITDATGSSYTIASASVADSDNYTVVVSSSCASIVSDPAVIVVDTCGINQAPHVDAGPDAPATVGVYTTLPGSVTDDGLPVGSSVTVTWTATGPGTVNFADQNSAYTGATFDTVGTYTLTLTATDGDKTASDQVVITVTPVNLTPVVNAGPDQSVVYSSGATLAGTASDDGLPTGSTLVTTWTYSGPGTVTSLNPDALNATVIFSVPGTYTFTLTANDGELSSSDDVVITATLPDPAITAQPQNKTAGVGQNVSFTVVAVGNTTLHYQWKKGTTSISTGTQATLSLNNIQMSDAGTYSVVVSDDAGLVTSSGAVLTVRDPFIVSQPQSQDAIVGADVTFSVSAIGSGTLTYQWAFGGNAISGATDSSYTKQNAQLTDAGIYTVTVTGSAGSVDSAAATLAFSSTPLAKPDFYQVNEIDVADSQQFPLDVLANDANASSVTTFSSPTKGTVVSIDSGKSLSYTPNVGATGVDTFTYTMTGSAGGLSTATVTVFINRSITSPVNTPPSAADHTRTIAVGETSVTIDLLSGATDPDNNTLSVYFVQPPKYGTVSLSAAGQLTYTPTAGKYDPDAFYYVINDGNGGMAIGNVLVNHADDDGDGMADGWEIAHNLDRTVDDANGDPDGDGLPNLAEFKLHKDPNVADNPLNLSDVASSSGRLEIPLAISAEVENLGEIVVLVDGEVGIGSDVVKTASGWVVAVDTTVLANGPHTVQLIYYFDHRLSVPSDQSVAVGTAASFEVDNMVDFLPESSYYSGALHFLAEVNHPFDSYLAEVRTLDGQLVHTFTGSGGFAVGAIIDETWDLTIDGVRIPVQGLTMDVTFDQAAPQQSSFKHRSDADKPPVRKLYNGMASIPGSDFVACWGDAKASANTSRRNTRSHNIAWEVLGDLDTWMDSYYWDLDGGRDYTLAPAANVALTSAYEFQTGKELADTLAAGGAGNFFWWGHGNPWAISPYTGEGSDVPADPIKGQMTSTQLMLALDNGSVDIFGKPSRMDASKYQHPYRLVYLNCCEANSAAWVQAFGIAPFLSKPKTWYESLNLEPQAFLAYDRKPFIIPGDETTDNFYTQQILSIFFDHWMRGDTVANCVGHMNNKIKTVLRNDGSEVFIDAKYLHITGCPDLTTFDR